ncbi:hypothetical protein L0337_04420 [candidate division KSB1 bacterium]|nr:hypothetical protein [candidate division KSB1 bacterium]
MPNQDDFQTVFKKLKGVLKKYEPHLTVKGNTADAYYLDAGFSEKYKRVVFFGSVQIKKNYVSYYLMPVYVFPELLKGISPDLKKRMQGKSCFNFAAADEKIFSELVKLTKNGFDRFKQEGLV